MSAAGAIRVMPSRFAKTIGVFGIRELSLPLARNNFICNGNRLSSAINHSGTKLGLQFLGQSLLVLCCFAFRFLYLLFSYFRSGRLFDSTFPALRSIDQQATTGLSPHEVFSRGLVSKWLMTMASIFGIQEDLNSSELG